MSFLKTIILGLAFSMITFPSVAASTYTLTHEQWSIPKDAVSILKMSGLKSVLIDFNKSSSSKLQIIYPGGDEGTLWASELQAWFVSFGVPARQIELRPGSRENNIIEMRVDRPLFGTISN
ncbi:MAG: hypothetical protein OEY52_15795 [Gammaproteobacteria bacterium]|nr:hypothetical protein [Gammaproteobacteria bacterium]